MDYNVSNNMITKKKFSIIASSVLVFLGLAGLATYVFLSPFKADENPIIETSITLPINNERFVYTDTPLIQGKSTTGNVINIFDNDVQVGSASSNASGNFYYKTSTAFATGIHKIVARNNANSSDSSYVIISVNTSDPSKAILKAENTSIIENDHPYFGNGINKYDAIQKMMRDPDNVEADFAKMEKSGIKMARIINYTIDDMLLPDPVSPPTAVVSDGGGMREGDYVYRYTCSNLSRVAMGEGIPDDIPVEYRDQAGFFYYTAETLPSAATEIIHAGANQKITLTLQPCAKSYRYYIYRRNSNESEETLFAYAENIAGEVTTFVDDGRFRPTKTWVDPTDAPTLELVAPVDQTKILPAGTYVYRYTMSQPRPAYAGRFGAFLEGKKTADSPIATIETDGTKNIKVTVPQSGWGTWNYIYRRNSVDAIDSEKKITTTWCGKSVAGCTGETSWVDDGSYGLGSSLSSAAINQTTSYSMPSTNQTQNNPLAGGPASQMKHFMTGFDNNNWNEDALVASDKVMALAKKYNIRIMFTFVDQHDNLTGGIRQITRNCGVADTAFYSDQCSKDMMKNIINKFTTRTNSITNVPYKDDPAIFAWELTNEIYDTSGGGNGSRLWLTEMGDYLKDATRGPNHMLSSGVDGQLYFTHNYQSAYNAGNRNDFVGAGLPESIDLLTWHGYPESTSNFLFSYGGYRQTADSTKLIDYSDENQPDETWWNYWGQQVHAPLNLSGAIVEMEKRAHYAYLLNKPVIFGEWGVDWDTSTGIDWINGLSSAILAVKPDLVKGDNAFLGGDFNRPEETDWASPTTNILEIDNSNTYNNHPSLKISPSSNTSIAISTKFDIKPNTKYWYEFVIKNPNDKDLQIRFKTYKDGIEVQNSIAGANYNKNINDWSTQTRFNRMLCEMITPDVDQAEIYINLSVGVVGEVAWIGQIRLYELVPPTTEDVGSTFASTGWWDIDLDYTRDALINAAVNFANASMVSLAPLSDPYPDPEDPTPPPTNTAPPDTTTYLNLPSDRFSTSWNMVAFPDTSGSINNDVLGLSLSNGIKLRSYNGASNSYQKGDISPLSLTPGKGYWLKVDDTNRINGLKYPLAQTSSTEIGVTKGWNLLGNPYQSDLPLSNLQVKYKDGSTRSYSDAIVRKEVAGYVWSYEGSEKKYYFIAINPNNYKSDSPKSTVIKPFRGFWTIVKSDNISSIVMGK